MTLLFGGVGTIAGIASTSNWNENIMGTGRSTPILIFAGTMAVAGIITGAIWPKYKTIYSKNHLTYKINPQLYSLNNKLIPSLSIGIKINLMFN